MGAGLLELRPALGVDQGGCHISPQYHFHHAVPRTEGIAMSTVIPSKLTDGSTRHQGQLLSGRIIHREERTFERNQAASAWLEKRKTELAKPGTLERLKEQDPPSPRSSTAMWTNRSERFVGQRRKSFHNRSLRERPLPSTDKVCVISLSVDKLTPFYVKTLSVRELASCT